MKTTRVLPQSEINFIYSLTRMLCLDMITPAQYAKELELCINYNK